SCTRSIPPQCY
nr:Chain B, 11-mer peptide [synthetic construct]